MKLILIYGPPAVGKMTVANALSDITGYPLFHNHLTIDLVETLYTREQPMYKKLLWDLRFKVFEEAADSELEGMLFTMVYTCDREPLMRETMDIVRKRGGEVHLVHLHCAADTLYTRVSNEGRQAFRKITSVSLLKQVLSDWMPQKPYGKAQLDQSLSINTDQHSPEQAAQQIQQSYKLPIKSL